MRRFISQDSFREPGVGMTSSEPQENTTAELFLKTIFPNVQSSGNFRPMRDEEPPQVGGERIKHDHIDLLGHTTNILVFSYFDINRGKQFTRENVRMAIDSHKRSLKNYLPDKDISRIQSGKAAVDYWIDRLVENDEVLKKNSNPVRFWRSPKTDKGKLKPLLRTVGNSESKMPLIPIYHPGA